MDLRRKFLEDSANEKCWGGLDLGLIDDWTCYVLFFPRPRIEGIIFDNPTIVPYFWIPEANLPEKERRWGVPLQSWIRAGDVHIIEGDMVDTRIVADAIKQLCLNGPGKIQGIGYDKWQALTMMETLAEEFKSVEIKAVEQQ